MSPTLGWQGSPLTTDPGRFPKPPKQSPKWRFLANFGRANRQAEKQSPGPRHCTGGGDAPWTEQGVLPTHLPSYRMLLPKMKNSKLCFFCSFFEGLMLCSPFDVQPAQTFWVKLRHVCEQMQKVAQQVFVMPNPRVQRFVSLNLVAWNQSPCSHLDERQAEAPPGVCALPPPPPRGLVRHSKAK